MADFMIRFFICNIFISGIILIFLISRHLFKNILSARMQYNLWFILLLLLVIPFIPFRLTGFVQSFLWLENPRTSPLSTTGNVMENILGTNNTNVANWMNDFTLSVESQTASLLGILLFWIWTFGILAMIVLVIKSALYLRTIEKSALPLQNPEVRRLYRHCLDEMGIQQEIPIYSTAFLKSPIIVGFLKPCIYLPIHLISDDHASDIRYMLLHELQHYKHKDALANYLMNLAGVFYWFHPFIWYALKEMRIDREIACDTSVLMMLEAESYEDYGTTLINFAEKISLTPFPFAAGISGNMKQMKRRIINIASFEKPNVLKKLKSLTVFILITALLLGFAPFLSTYGADESYYHWETSAENISYTDLSEYFGTYEGSFVLYDLKRDVFSIHDMEHALLRVSPNSTYKIYDALFGLEEGIITPKDSFMAWDGENYPFEAWNANQTLQSAMDSSVNWYFQKIDEQLGSACIDNYLKEIGYGNQNISGDLTTYWMESSLKISGVEQVELLIKLYHNSFGFASENVDAVKDSLCLSASKNGLLYGKTGTGRVDGQDVTGWFTGFIETSENTYFFATNILAEGGATGSMASKITLSIMSDMNILNTNTILHSTLLQPNE